MSTIGPSPPIPPHPHTLPSFIHFKYIANYLHFFNLDIYIDITLALPHPQHNPSAVLPDTSSINKPPNMSSNPSNNQPPVPPGQPQQQQALTNHNNNNKLSYLAKLPSVSSPIQIDGNDVIKIVSQFLSESGLHRTLRALQDETDVRTNSVDDVTKFYNDILIGQWQSVFQQLHAFQLPEHLIFQIYDQVVLELCEVGEFDTAQHLLENVEALKALKTANQDRHRALSNFIFQRIDDRLTLYGPTPKQQRRQNIVENFKSVVVDAPKHRLMQIISHALRYQQLTGLLPQNVTNYNFFEDKLASHSIEEQRPAITLYHDIDCNAGLGKSVEDLITVSCALFTTNGRYLITGNSIGLIEVWDYDRGKLALDLEYQQQGEFMKHLHPITALAVSNDSELLASASANGDIRVWSILTGQVILSIRQGHSSSIGHLQFSTDGLVLLSAAENEVKSWNLQNTAVFMTYHTESQVVYCCYPSLNLQQLVSDTILILDSNGTYYLYTNNDLILKKQLTTTLSPKVSGLFYDKDNDPDQQQQGANRNKKPVVDKLEVYFNAAHNNNNHNTSTSIVDSGDGGSAYKIQLYGATPIRIRPDTLLITSRGDNSLYTLSDQSGDVLALYHTAYNPHDEEKSNNNLAMKKPKQMTPEKLAMFNVDLLMACPSALAKYIYAVTPQNTLYVFHFETKKIEKIFSPHGNNVILATCHHPFRNLFVTTSLDGTIKIWR